MASGSKHVILLAMFANAGIAIAKFIAAAFTGSSAMLAEGVHSCADTTNQVLLLFGMSRAKKPPTETHPFGYAMESYFWSFIVAVMLFSLGGLFSIYEANHKYHEVFGDHAAHGEEHPGDHDEELAAYEEKLEKKNTAYWAAIAVLVFGILLEGYSWWVATKEMNHRRRLRKRTMWQYIRHSKAPEIVVIWLEDTGALIGLVLALVGVSLTMITGNPIFDIMASAAIGVLLILIAIIVGAETKSLLIGEAAYPETRQRIREIVEEADDLVKLHEQLTLQLGEHDLLVALKTEWKPSLSTAELIQRKNAVEAAIRKEFPRAKWIFVEPDTKPESAGGAVS